MTYQQIIEQKNLDVSIVEVKELENNNRIDSDFYAVDILWLRNNLKEKWATKLKDLNIIVNRWVNPDYDENWEIKVLRSVNIRENWFSNIRQDYINEEYYSSISNWKARKNDILLNTTWVWTLWRSAFVFTNEKYVFSQDVVALRNYDYLYPEFLFVYLNSIAWQKQINTLYKWSSGQIHLYPDDIKELLVPIPSFQQKIAELVQESYKQREESKKLYSQAEQVLLKELWLEDYQPTENNISIKDSEEIDIFWRIDAEFFQPKYDEIIEKIKNYHWWWDHLDNLITISNKRIKKEENKSFQYIELADINASLGTVNSNNKILSQDLPSRAQMKIEKNDVLVSSIRGSAEKVAIVDHNKEDFVASTWFFILKPKFFNAETNLILMKSWIYRELLKRTARGMILEASNKNDFSKFVFPKLDEKVQSKIAQLVQDSHKALENSKNLLEKAKKSVEIFIEKDETKAIKFLENKEF